jgi:isopentenyl phosphate kinase
LIYGDVALDEVLGGTIVSTEELFAWLALRLKPQRIVLVGVVPGVIASSAELRDRAEVIPQITPARLASASAFIGGSHGTDVTGGMRSKVEAMCALVERLPSLRVQLVSGEVQGLVREVLANPAMIAGTLIHSGYAHQPGTDC